MKTLLINLLFIITVSGARCQGNMPPSIVILFDEQNIGKEVLKKDIHFVLQHFTGTVKKSDIRNNAISFDTNSFNYIYDSGININLERVTEHHQHVYPKKGDNIGLYLYDKSGNKMRIFIRICTDLYLRAVLQLKGLEFKEGNYFYDMCSSEPDYEIIYKRLCPEHFQGDNTVFDPFLHLNDGEDHKISITRLNRILKKYRCHE